MTPYKHITASKKKKNYYIITTSKESEAGSVGVTYYFRGCLKECHSVTGSGAVSVGTIQHSLTTDS